MTDLCPRCHRMLYAFCNFCECGFVYDPQELSRPGDPPKVDLVFRSKDIRTVENDTFEMSHAPEPEKEESTDMPGWWWKEQKKKKKAREEAQHKLQLGVQLNMFEKTVSGAQNKSRKKRGS